MTLSPLGDSALVLSFGEDVDDSTLTRVRVAADALRGARIAGLVDVVPAFATVTLYLDLAAAGAVTELEQRVQDIVEHASTGWLRSGSGEVHEIPVCYGGEYGPDIDEVAQRAGLAVGELIERHGEPEYVVQAIGFVPGFAYLGGLPAALHVPRRATPRPRVPAGSVGIGGTQTGVYPLVTPGGWNLIGRSPLRLFDPARARPARLRAGDRVKFRAISPEEFVAWK